MHHLSPMLRREGPVTGRSSGCQDLVRFFALLRIKPHAPPLVRVPHRLASHRSASHRLEPRRSAPHRSAPHRSASRRSAPRLIASKTVSVIVFPSFVYSNTTEPVQRLRISILICFVDSIVVNLFIRIHVLICGSNSIFERKETAIFVGYEDFTHGFSLFSTPRSVRESAVRRCIF